jgi:hypothetical protein
MADKGHQGFASMDEERQREIASEGGHASHEKGAAREFNNQAGGDEGRKGVHARTMANANRETVGGTQDAAERSEGGGQSGGEQPRPKRTRGGTHAQHVTAGKKGGSRIRQLIELGYKYEQEHGIGPGQNERSKLAAKRRAARSLGSDEGEADDAET